MIFCSSNGNIIPSSSIDRGGGSSTSSCSDRGTGNSLSGFCYCSQNPKRLCGNLLLNDEQVILKIIKHCKEFSPALVTGQLLGLDVGSILEVTNCFPFPVDESYLLLARWFMIIYFILIYFSIAQIREEDEEIEADGANYQLEMMRCLREVNVDNNTVGW